MAEIAYPYRTFSDQPKLAITSLRVDGMPPETDVVTPALGIVRLYSLEESWSRVTMELTVSAPADEVDAFDNGGATPEATAVAFCSGTDARPAQRLDRDPTDKARWTGSIELDKASFRGKVGLYAVVAGETSGLAHALLGESSPWSVYFDEPAIPPIEGMLPVQWVDFKNAEEVPDEARGEAFYVALLESPPVVLLNSSFAGLSSLLSDEHPENQTERAFRDAEYRRIATATWAEIFAAGMRSVTEGEPGEGLEWPEADWQRSALEALLPRIYPGNADDALKKAYDALNGDGHIDLEARLHVAINQQIGAAASLKQNLRAIG